jgi:hypothetical protein
VLYVIVAATILFGIWLWFRTQELFCVSVRGGRALVVRGRIPGGLLGDFRDALRRAKVRDVTLRGVKTERGGRLVVTGAVDPGTVQQLRNIFGTYTVARLRTAPPIERPTLGQVLGIAWLAWLLDSMIRK